MGKAKSTAFSGCLIWLFLIALIGSCVMPVFWVVGSVSGFSEFAIKTTGGWLCPEGTTPESYSYATTSRDENGFERPSTAYELHCVDEAGNVVKSDPVMCAFIRMGVLSEIGVIVSVVLSFILAVPEACWSQYCWKKGNPRWQKRRLGIEAGHKPINLLTTESKMPPAITLPN